MMKRIVLHPFLLAIYFILFLFSYNIQHFPIEVIFIPVIVSLSLALLCWSLLTFILKDGKKAGLITSLFILLFFTYGHFYDVLLGIPFIRWHIGGNVLVSAVYATLSLVGIYFTVKAGKNLDNLTMLINSAASFLVIISLLNIAIYKFKTRNNLHGEENKETIAAAHVSDSKNLKETTTLPNIYYIILDGYGRADILEEIYNYKNTELVNYLTQKNFYIAKNSQSNYAHTFLSLASSLNFDYVENLFSSINRESTDRSPFYEKIKKSRVVDFLRQRGYRFVVFPTGFYGTDLLKDADVYMSAGLPIGEFQRELVEATPLAHVMKIFEDSYDFYRKKILYVFDRMGNTIKMKPPLFVFAHLLVPHPPFMFGPNGEEITPNRSFSHGDGVSFLDQQGATRREYLEGYKNQVIFVNKKLKTMIAELLSGSTTPPIIILQGDHGPGLPDVKGKNGQDYETKQRMSIFNAYYFPDNDYSSLYDYITPVNTFRIIFNRYFGTNLELLKDQVICSGYHSPFKIDKSYLSKDQTKFD